MVAAQAIVSNAFPYLAAISVGNCCGVKDSNSNPNLQTLISKEIGMTLVIGDIYDVTLFGLDVPPRCCGENNMSPQME